MRYFALAIKTGGISKAAASLELAQTALSIQIRDLEREVGVKLLERHSRGVLPTAAGELLYKRYNELEGFLEQTLQDVRNLGGVTAKPFAIGLNPSIMRLVGADILIEAASKMPSVSMRLVEELSYALVEAMERGELDLAFAYDIDNRPGIIREAVMEDELLFVTSPASAKGDGPISFAEAISHELFFAGDRGIVSLVRQTAQRLSLQPRIVSDIQSVPAIRARIAEGGASLLPYGTAADGVRRGVFAMRRVERPVLTRTLYMIRRSGEHSVLDESLIGKFLRNMVRSIYEASVPYSSLIDPRFAELER